MSTTAYVMLKGGGKTFLDLIETKNTFPKNEAFCVAFDILCLVHVSDSEPLLGKPRQYLIGLTDATCRDMSFTIVLNTISEDDEPLREGFK